MEQPTSASEIRSFLGMANFSCHFIKNYSNVTAPPRALIRKNAKFEWTIECQTAFDTIRTALREDSLNVYFAPNRETKVIVDGSKKDGVVRYDSRPVTPQEKHYSQIEIESAAVEYGNTKYHIYLYGLEHYHISTDHRPLLPLFNTYKHEMPPRLLKNKIYMQGYNYTPIHEPGASNPIEYMS